MRRQRIFICGSLCASVCFTNAQERVSANAHQVSYDAVDQGTFFARLSRAPDKLNAVRAVFSRRRCADLNLPLDPTRISFFTDVDGI